MSDSEHSVCTACHGQGRTDVPVCTDCGYRAPRPAASLSRDELGRIVRDAWVRWARQQPNLKPSWILAYDDLADEDKEADRLIGEAVVAAIEPPRPASGCCPYCGGSDIDIMTTPGGPADSSDTTWHFAECMCCHASGPLSWGKDAARELFLSPKSP